jgi:hypothetical protein
MDGWGRAACKREPPAEIPAKAILRRPQQMTGLIGIARSPRLKPQSQTMEMTAIKSQPHDKRSSA